MKLLEAVDVSQVFEGEEIIRNIHLELNKGEIVCLIGSSGVGKTTLFHVLSGLEKPRSGRVCLNGEDITGQAGKISYMLQKDLLLPHMTIQDNIALPLVIQGEKKKIAREKTKAYFEVFGLEGTEKKYPSQLSGGMRQRAALLRTYLFSDQVALLDEPFSALDAITKKQMHQWYLKVMKEIQLSTIFISHDMDEALTLADRIYVMAKKPGEIIAEIKVDRGDMSSEEFLLSESYLEKKKEILHYLSNMC